MCQMPIQTIHYFQSFSFLHLSDGVSPVCERALRIPNQPIAHVRVHDQLHTQTQTPAREVHDELGAGKLHNTSGWLVSASVFASVVFV